jgi:hypothetical protein
MSTMNVSKPINIPSLKSDQLKAKSAFIPTMSFFPHKLNVWDARKNTHGGEWKEKFDIWSENISKNVRHEWNTERDLVNLEKNLRTKLELIVPLLQNDWHTQFEEPENSCCNSLYPSDDDNDDDICISEICHQRIEDKLEWKSQESHKIYGGFTAISKQGIDHSRFTAS